MTFCECVYAYLNSYNFLGEIDGNYTYGIYTITEGSDTQKIGNLVAPYFDMGLYMVSEQGAGDSVYSFAYYPNASSERRVVCKSTLRASLKGEKKFRTQREVLHAVIFDKIPDSSHVADCAKKQIWNNHTDIRLNEKDTAQAQQTSNRVVEERPNMLTKICEGDIFTSPADFLVKDGTQRGMAADIISALERSQRDGKKLFFVYAPENWNEAREIMLYALKCLAPAVANSISFITCYGKYSIPQANFCGVATRDEEYISLLKSKGYVIELNPSGTSIGGEVGKREAYAAFLADAGENDLSEWGKGYYLHLSSFEALNETVTLFKDCHHEITYSTEDFAIVVRDLSLFLKYRSAISEMPGETKRVLDFLEERTKSLLIARINVEPSALYEKIFLQFLKISSENREDLSPTMISELHETLLDIIFGTNSDRGNNAELHIDVLTHFGENALNKLEEQNIDLFSYLHREWRNGLRELFERFINLNSPAAEKIFYTLIRKYILQDKFDEEVYNYLLKKYLEPGEENWKKIFPLIFNQMRNQPSVKFYRYILQDMISADEQLVYFKNYIILNGQLESALPILKEQYCNRGKTVNSARYDHNVEEFFKMLLDESFRLPPEATLKDVNDRFMRARMLLSLNGEITGLYQVVFERFNETAIISQRVEQGGRVTYWPLYRLDMGSMTQGFYDELVAMYSFLSGDNLVRDVVEGSFCNELRITLEGIRNYLSGSERLSRLKNFRVAFVIRELLLLDCKTIYNVMCDEETIGKRFVDENLPISSNKSKPYEDEKFLDNAKEIATNILSSKEFPETNKKKFVKKIHEIRRSRNNLSRVKSITDFMGGIIQSSIISLMMCLLVGGASFFINKYLSNGFFQSVYLVFGVIGLIVTELFYWLNYPKRRVRCVWVRAIMQSALTLLAMFLLYFGLQWILTLLHI